ncbi:hypothetical protein K0M31_000111 [Melipona bicolor]|uniref:Uncharacterized protein n=1 Tax=Melipona bicolor TaxID=60889 RepID=A0AA40GD37_9HYME|nr:hypothetical protein K0M31_000111 [Melipona bicolor]
MYSYNFLANKDENPVTGWMKKMKIPLLAGMGLGIWVQAFKYPSAFETHLTFKTVAYTTLPVCGFGFFYLTGTYIASKIRNEDSPGNYAIGALCTIPVVRTFLPLVPTCHVVTLLTLFSWALAYEFSTEWHPFPTDGQGFDMYSWSKQKPPSEPYIKRKSNSWFTLLPSE